MDFSDRLRAGCSNQTELQARLLHIVALNINKSWPESLSSSAEKGLPLPAEFLELAALAVAAGCANLVLDMVASLTTSPA